MESVYIKITLLLLGVLLCVSCSKPEESTAKIPPVEDGDIICRLGNGMFSNLFRSQSAEKIYSHVGILRFVNDSLFVVHAEAGELTGMGHVKAEPWQSFLDNSRQWGIYRMKQDPSSRRQIAVNAFRYVENQTPFDVEFNPHDDDKVYCTELVALAINQAMDEPLILPGGKMGDLLFYSVDDIYLHPGFTCIYTNH